jgi:hypothetical protein
MPKLPKNLIKDTQKLIRIRLFLDECGLRRYRLSVRQLREISKALKPQN